MQEMDLEKNTLVVFTSDNGNEMGAGTGSVYKEGKRSLMVVAFPTMLTHTYIHRYIHTYIHT